MGVFQGQYLLSLSINYVAINNNLEKLPTQLHQIKIKKIIMIKVTMTLEQSQQRNDATTYFTCSRISRHWKNIGQLRWLDGVFQGQYLLSLSINYVAINNNLEKLPTQLHQIKIKKIIMIKVTMTLEQSQQRNDATTYFTCSRISRHWDVFFQNCSREIFPRRAASIYQSVIKILWE